ncbi:serine hydrolase-domain-containing protein [Hypoxylon sp. FL1857]|nr:serine hydrolase-domain-containing protein [Hypoxylon sp. FL1857]
MRIICIYRDGRNGETYHSELDILLSKLRSLNTEVSIDFLDGHSKCLDILIKDAPVQETQFLGIGEVEKFRKAGKELAMKLDRDGPYDGVLAFSQGAALVSSFLLYRQWYDHELPPPFKFAIFISGSIPLKVLRDLGVPVSKEAEHVVAQAGLRRDEALGPLPTHTTKARRAVFNSDDCFGLNLNRIPLELKIRIPTVHVWGENDPVFPTSIQLAGLCDPYIRKIYTHPGGHEMPHEEKEVVEIVLLIEWCIQRGSWPGQTIL